MLGRKVVKVKEHVVVFVESHVEIDTVRPEVDVALALQVALGPDLELLLPAFLNADVLDALRPTALGARMVDLPRQTGHVFHCARAGRNCRGDRLWSPLYGRALPSQWARPLTPLAQPTDNPEDPKEQARLRAIYQAPGLRTFYGTSRDSPPRRPRTDRAPTT